MGHPCYFFAVTCVNFFSFRKRYNEIIKIVLFGIFNHEKAFLYKESLSTADLSVQGD